VAFPQDPLPIRAEMLINGTWTDVTDSVRGEHNIRIQSGTRVDSTDLGTSSCDFSLNNRDGVFSNDNPMSAYYGLLPLNTNFRVSVEEADVFLRLPNGLTDDPLTGSDWEGSWVRTTDKAVLDVTADLDLRIEVDPDYWHLGSVGHVLASKYLETGSQRSWVWSVQPSGVMRLYWSSAGADPIAAGTYATSTAAIPSTNRTALRVTIDVNNGAAGRTITFYTSDSITGTWTQLGSSVVQAGTTSIFSSSAQVQVGAAYNTSTTTHQLITQTTVPALLPLVGRVHRFQMYNGIAGTLVADMRPSTQAEGTTSWSDGLGTPNTWTVEGDAELTVADYQAYTELSELPQEWDPTGTDVWVPVNSSGIVRRMTKSPASLRSAFYYYNANVEDLAGYWSMEDKPGTATPFPTVPGTSMERFSGVAFGSQQRPPGSDALADVRLRDASTFLFTGGTDESAGGWQLSVVANMTDMNDGFYTVVSATMRNGSYFSVSLDDNTNEITILGSTAALATLFNTTTSYGSYQWSGRWIMFVFYATFSAGTTTVTIDWRAIDEDSWTSRSDTYVGNTSNLREAYASGFPDGSTFGHVIGTHGTSDDLTSDERWTAFLGHEGEAAATRWMRLCRQEGVRGVLVGWPDDTELMGAQSIGTLAEVLDECVRVDAGLHYEAPDQAAIIMRTRKSLLSQNRAALDYSLAHLNGGFRPSPDDLLTRNVVTAQNPDGSFSVSERTEGQKSTQQPPNGVGPYNTILPVNTYERDRLANLAQYSTFIGTWPEKRVPNIEVWLQRDVYVQSATLTRTMRALSIGDRLAVDNVPIWVGGGTIDTLVRTYTKVLKNRGFELAFGTVPYGPYLAVNDLTDGTNTRDIASASNSSLNASLTSSATSFVVKTPTGATWAQSASKPSLFPLLIEVGGEQMSVGAIGAPSGVTQTQTFSSVTRAVNGITKSHSADASVDVVNKFYATL
jgi:hypothetical protein